MALEIKFFVGSAVGEHLAALARLRIAVFREWPYLYDGSVDNEQAHLASLAASPGAGLAVAFAGAEPVGCSTCQPLAEADAAVIAPFAARGWDPGRFFYFGESVLLPQWRGQGVGVAFFREREAHALRSSGADYACFCAVRRPAAHPLRPAGAVPLDAFWRRRGYTPYPDLVCTMHWKQVDGPDRVENQLSFWIKPLRDVALP
jgi:GNAT superfamily N-acetyltransferase